MLKTTKVYKGLLKQHHSQQKNSSLKQDIFVEKY